MGNAPLRRAPSRTNSAVPRRRSNSMVPPTLAERRAISVDANDQVKRSSGDSVKKRSKAFRSSNNLAASADNTSHTNRSDKYSLTHSQKEMIKGNWDANRDRRYDIARRIYGRTFNKRPDVRELYERIGVELWAEEAKKLGDFMNTVIQNVDDTSIIERLSLELGRRHGDWRAQGFKPEFWVAFAESMTKECVYLDLAVHPAGEVLEAWSKLVGLIFGWARDGYYEKVRLQRQLSRKAVTKSTSMSSPSLSNSSRSNSTEEQPIIINRLAGPNLPTIEAFGTESAAI